MGLISDEGGPGFAGTESEPCHGLQAVMGLESAGAAVLGWLTGVSRTTGLMLLVL